MAGYDEKLAIVGQDCEGCLRSHSNVSPENMFNVHSVPLNTLTVAATTSEPCERGFLTTNLSSPTVTE